MLAPGTACLASRIQIASWQHIKIQFVNSALFSPCHPERSEGSAFPGPKNRSFAMLRMTDVNCHLERCFRLGNDNGQPR